MLQNEETAAPTEWALAMHPGEFLADHVLPGLKARKIGKVDVASALGVSRQTLDKLLNRKIGVSPDMALRLGRYFRQTPAFWLDMQRGWDLAEASTRLAGELERIEPLAEAEVEAVPA